MPIHFHIVYGCYFATVDKLNSCNTDILYPKTEIFTSGLLQKKFAISFSKVTHGIYSFKPMGIFFSVVLYIYETKMQLRKQYNLRLSIQLLELCIRVIFQTLTLSRKSLTLSNSDIIFFST